MVGLVRIYVLCGNGQNYLKKTLHTSYGKKV